MAESNFPAGTVFVPGGAAHVLPGDQGYGWYSPAYMGESVVTLVNRTQYALSYSGDWNTPLTDNAQVKIYRESARCAPLNSPPVEMGGVNHLVKDLVTTSKEMSEGNKDKRLEMMKLTKAIMKEK